MFSSECRNFLKEARKNKRVNSHGSLRHKKKYGFLSVCRISKTKFKLMIFIPVIKHVISFEFSEKDGMKISGAQKIGKQNALKIVNKALSENTKNLPKVGSGKRGKRGWEGLYFMRLGRNKSPSEKSKKVLRKAFDGSIPKEFINFVLDSGIILSTEGKTPFEYETIPFEKIIS